MKAPLETPPEYLIECNRQTRELTVCVFTEKITTSCLLFLHLDESLDICGRERDWLWLSLHLADLCSFLRGSIVQKLFKLVNFFFWNCKKESIQKLLQ